MTEPTAPELLSAGDRVAVETRPPGADRYATWWKVWLPIPLLLLALDVSFNLWFWHLPKLTGNSADYSYQYLYDLEHLKGTKHDDVVRVVAFGSSVSSAFDPFQVQSLLDAKHLPEAVEVRRLTKPGTKPSDHHLVWQSELGEVRPDVVVMVFNLVDFLNPSFERDLKPDIRYVLPPWRTLMQRWKNVPTVAEKLQLVVASVSNLYRYRRPLQSAIEDNVRAIGRWATSGRGSGGGYGWYDDGYTAERFGVPLSALPGRSFDYYINPAWIAQRGAVHLKFAIDGRPLAEVTESEPGWKSQSLGKGIGGVLEVEADSTWTPRASGLGDDVRLLGVQLRETPPSSVNHGRPPFRWVVRAQSEPDEFLRMGALRGPQYAEKWYETLNDQSDFSQRFRKYRDVKLALKDQTFRPQGEYAAVRRMVEEFTRAGTRVILVNTPESPLLEGLSESAWYQQYLEFFRTIPRENPLVRFVDLHDALPAEDLNDWHHVNYVGQMKLGPVFAAVLAEEIAKRDATAAGGSDRAL